MLGADALTPVIVERVRGQDDIVCQNLSGPMDESAIICHQLFSLACVTSNAFHLWLKTSFEEKTIITLEALTHAPQDVCDILLLVKDNTFTIYVCEPLPSGKDHIEKL